MTHLAEPPRAAAASGPDLAAIKQRQQATWASGDFAVIGTTLQIVGEQLAESVDVRAGELVLDVAAGNGNATLAAARRFATVTSTDYVPELLAKGAARAQAEGLAVEFLTADAEALPFADGSFDVALSTFGVMFAPDAPRAAAELLRVVRRGGRIGLASWTAEGFLGELFRVVGAHVPPPAGLASPMQWGDERRIVELFASEAGDIRCQRRHFQFRYHSPEHWVKVFRDFYGPTHKAFAALDEAGRQRLHAALVDLLERHNTAGPASLVVPGEYLEVVVTRG
jgi:ubiquinone/menaquinone biosynthesis C-methylase UbiE